MLDNSKYKQPYSIKVKSLIKFHRKGSLFSFVKASKYYLSSLLKLSVYKLISDNLKISKWEQKHKERYDNLQHAIKQYKFIKQAILQSQIWLNSTEFQEKYIDTKHPYPPLLDPSAVDYESISAELAYELNLPLPPKYDLIIISGSNMGHNALLDFLEKCGAKRGQDHLPKNLKTIYTSFYNFLVNPANASDFKILPFVQYDYLDYTEVEFRRYCDFFSRKVPILVQVRDPFIKLLLVNSIDFQANKTRFFTLNDNLPAVLDMFEYVYDLNLQKALNYLIAPHILRQSTAIKGVKKTQIDFIDTDNELMPNNAYETTKKLAQRYKLIEPKDKTFFEKTFEQNQILACALLKAKRYFDDRCIASVITGEDMDTYHALPKHLEGIVAQLRSTKGVDVAILLYENTDGSYKASLRTNGAVDVAAICGRHGGGGHVRAAGATLHGEPEQLLHMLLSDVEEQLQAQQ